MADQCSPFLCHGVFWGAGLEVGHVGLAVASAACRRQPVRLGVSDKVPHPVNGGHPEAVSWGGRSFAMGGGERGGLVSGNVEEGLEEEVSDAWAQSGGLDKSGSPDGLGGDGGADGFPRSCSLEGGSSGDSQQGPRL